MDGMESGIWTETFCNSWEDYCGPKVGFSFVECFLKRSSVTWLTRIHLGNYVILAERYSVTFILLGLRCDTSFAHYLYCIAS